MESLVAFAVVAAIGYGVYYYINKRKEEKRLANKKLWDEYQTWGDKSPPWDDTKENK